MRVWWRRWRCAALLLVAVAMLAIRVPRSATLTTSLPHHEPTALAHYLADFSHHSLLDDDIGEWSVEEEAGNASWWQYSVNFSCGSRCVGRAAVTHAQPAAVPRIHTAAGGHTHAAAGGHTHAAAGGHTHAAAGGHTHAAAGRHTHTAAGRHTHTAAGPHTHRLHLRDTRCAPLLPLLPWPSICDELDTEIVIESGSGGGSVLEERVTQWVPLLWGRAPPAPRLARRAARLTAL